MLLSSALRVWLTRSIKPFLFSGNNEKTLHFSEVERLGLYVHIPFCRTLCPFCPYCKMPYERESAVRYKKALLQEIALVGGMTEKKRPVTSLYFGGGTPALMAEDLAEIIAALARYFTIEEGVGVELHPSDVTAQTLATLKAAGVTMISVGVQSFSKDCLAAIGRKAADFERIFALIREAAFETVDVDFIFALPNQSAQSLKTDIDTAFRLGATQISTYPFIDFSFADNCQKPQPEREKRALLKEITAHCTKNRYERTSVWTFAKTGTQKYSSITRECFLGFGVSATTLLKDSFKINTFSLDGYCERLEKNALPTALTLLFTPRQRAAYYLFWAAYSLELGEAPFARFFGASLSKNYRAELFCARLCGLLKKTGDGYRLTERGAYWYHFIEQAYTTAYIDKTWRVARVEAFPEKIVLK